MFILDWMQANEPGVVAMLVLVGCALVNRMRGDDRWKGGLPGRALYWTSPAVALLAWTVHEWPVALAFGVAYLVWGCLAWGRWFDLGRLPNGYAREGVPLTAFEWFITLISFGSDHVALFWRHFLLIVPGLALVGWLLNDFFVLELAPFFAILVVLCYEAAWRITERYPILIAELLVGVVWGALLLTVQFYG